MYFSLKSTLSSLFSSFFSPLDTQNYALFQLFLPIFSSHIFLNLIIFVPKSFIAQKIPRCPHLVLLLHTALISGFILGQAATFLLLLLARLHPPRPHFFLLFLRLLEVVDV